MNPHPRHRTHLFRQIKLTLLLSLAGIAVQAEPLKIIGFDVASGVTFQGATVGNYYTLEFAQTPGGPWTNWGSVTDQPITGAVMNAPSPFFYRIKQTDTSEFPPYAPASNIPTSMLADGAVTGDKIDSSTVQRRVTGSAPEGMFITGIKQDGTVLSGAPTLSDYATKAEVEANYIPSGTNVIFPGAITAEAISSQGEIRAAGSIQVGDNSEAAMPSNAGSLRFSSGNNALEVSDGTSWKPLGVNKHTLNSVLSSGQSATLTHNSNTYDVMVNLWRETGPGPWENVTGQTNYPVVLLDANTVKVTNNSGQTQQIKLIVLPLPYF